MNSKRIYFVRHGESEDDASDLHQRPTTLLSELGQHQVALLAGRFSHTSFDVIISSPLDCAIATAEEIAYLSHKNIEVSELFSEVKKPTVLEGVSREDAAYDPIRKVIQEKWSYPAWHYQDEENFVEVKRRAIAALNSLLGREESTMVVITHGHFLTMLFLTMALGKQVTAEEYSIFDTFSHTDNASISLCELTSSGWKMRIWNDITHITELIH